MATIGIVYYSMYGHNFELAQHIAEGVERDGGKPQLRVVPELLPDEVIESQDLHDVKAAQDWVDEARVDELPSFDGIIFGGPTRYGSAPAQLQNFFDQTGALWAKGELVGKPAGFFTGAATMHGGHESTILSMSTFAYHQGMLIVPAGYQFDAVGSTTTGGSPYGPGLLAPTDGSKDELSEDEISIARDYGSHFHAIAEKLLA